MSAGIGRVPFAPEVYPLQRKVGGDQRLVSGREIKDGAIITDSVEYASERGSTIGLGRLRSAPDSGNEL